MSSEMRVSDAEREATASELREHYASGRLSQDELDERLDRTFAAKTRGDLDAIMADLPSLRSGTPPLAGAGQGSNPGQGWNPGGGWGPGGTGWGQSRPGLGYPGTGSRGPCGAGQGISGVISMVIAICVLAGLGIMAAFGTGADGGRPIAIVLLLAAFALLRRLVFGRRRRARARQRRRRY